MEYVVRPATIDDCHTLAAFLQRLVVLRKEPGLVTQNSLDLKKDGFSEPPKFAAFLAEVKGEENGEAVGLALYSYRYSSFLGNGLLLNNLFVLEPHRGRGVASKLIRFMAREALDYGIKNMCFMSNSWNAIAKSLYQKMDAVDLTETKGLHAYELSGKSCCHKNHNLSRGIVIRKATLQDVPAMAQILKEFTKSQNTLIKNVNTDVIEDDGFGENPLFRAYVAEDVSINSENSGELLGILTYSYAYCSHSNTTIFLDSFYVSERHRRKGVGCALFNACQQEEVPKGRTRMRILVDCNSESAAHFLSHVGALDQSDIAQWVWSWVEEEDLRRFAYDSPEILNGSAI